MKLHTPKAHLPTDVAQIAMDYLHSKFTIFSTHYASAAKMLDGSVVTWGDADCGGDSSRVQAELKQGVDTICSTYYAFAAKMLDGSVVTWGDASYGGDSSRVQAELKQGLASDAKTKRKKANKVPSKIRGLSRFNVSRRRQAEKSPQTPPITPSFPTGPRNAPT